MKIIPSVVFEFGYTGTSNKITDAQWNYDFALLENGIPKLTRERIGDG